MNSRDKSKAKGLCATRKGAQCNLTRRGEHGITQENNKKKQHKAAKYLAPVTANRAEYCPDFGRSIARALYAPVAGRKTESRLADPTGQAMLNILANQGEHVVEVLTDLLFRCRGQGLAE